MKTISVRELKAHWAELINALRLTTFWGDIDKEKADSLIALFDDRCRRGQYHVPEIDHDGLMKDSRVLSGKTPRTGCGTMDILHVSCALQLRPESFISFDNRQRALASGAGLDVLPDL